MKLHTSYSGRFVLAGTYTNGDRKNEDSGAKVKFTNTAGDLMFMPVTSVIFSLRYRHYDQDVTEPATLITVTGLGTLNVRDSISSDARRGERRAPVPGNGQADAEGRIYGRHDGPHPGPARYATLAAPPVGAQAFWDVPKSTTKNTAKVGFNYRMHEAR